MEAAPDTAIQILLTFTQHTQLSFDFVVYL